MKKNMYVFWVLTLLFVASPVLAQNNFNVSMPNSGVFKLVQHDRHELLFEWKVPRNIGGDTYEGETAYEMSKAIAAPYSFLQFYNWGISRADNDYLYGYCRIVYIYVDYCVLTITGLRDSPDTVVVNMGGN